MKKWMVSIAILQFLVVAQAQARGYSYARPALTYDLGISTGTYSDNEYTELELGLNWSMTDTWVWRNSLFTRFGSSIDSASGLDTSARFVYNSPLNEGGIGVGLFAGPGIRLSNKENSGVFGEAGATLKAGGISIGGGVKSIYHPSPGHDANGSDRASSESVVFLILAAGGGF